MPEAKIDALSPRNLVDLRSAKKLHPADEFHPYFSNRIQLIILDMNDSNFSTDLPHFSRSSAFITIFSSPE